MKKCIGIISYLPNDSVTRLKRIELLNKTLQSVERLFDLPVIVIAQNWSDVDDIRMSKNMIVYKYDKLGISNARNELRKKFLESAYDYLIMLDDDCIIRGTSAEKYLKEIDEHPDSFMYMYLMQLKLCAISRAVYEKIEMPDVDVEKNEAIEDKVFFYTLKYMMRNKMFMFSKNCGISIDLNSTFNNSTWRKSSTNYLKLIMNTDKIINHLRRVNWLLKEESELKDEETVEEAEEVKTEEVKEEVLENAE